MNPGEAAHVGSGPRIKICGVTRREDADLAVELGAAALGFVFWKGSPRLIPLDRARAIARGLQPFVERVGVFVDEDVEAVAATAEAVPLSAVQLHGDEDVAVAGALARPVIKAVSPAHGRAAEVASRWPPWILLLVDVHDPSRRGGTGEVADWDWAAELAALRPIVLSGGLRAENVEQAVTKVRPYGLDVSSGVERAPGIKDAAKLKDFFAAVRACEGRSGATGGAERTGGPGRWAGEAR
jgi:phosphoribosylanthranilate isomerase